jgi:septal ring factor EnvC (AmiA/AmiB activator)
MPVALLDMLKDWKLFVAIGLALAVGAFCAYEHELVIHANEETAQVQGQLSVADTSLGTVKAQLAQSQADNATLQQSIATQNSAVAKWQAQAQAVTAAAAAAQMKAAVSQQAANAKIAALEKNTNPKESCDAVISDWRSAAVPDIGGVQ